MINKNRIFLIGKIAIALLLLFFLFKGVDLKEFVETVRKSDIRYILGGTLVVISSITIMQSLKLYILLKEFTEVKFLFTVRMILLSLFYNNLLPGSVGGDLVKIFYIKKEKDVLWKNLLLIVMVEKISGLGALFLIGISYMLFNYQEISSFEIFSEKNLQTIRLVFTGLFIAGLIGLIAIFLLRQKIGAMIYRYIVVPIRSIGLLTYTLILGLSIAFHLIRMMGMYMFVVAFGEQIRVYDMMFVLFATAMVSALPISIGAIGLREGALTYTLTLFGISKIAGIGVSLVYRIVITISGLLGLYYFFKLEAVSLKEIRENIRKEREEEKKILEEQEIAHID